MSRRLAVLAGSGALVGEVVAAALAAGDHVSVFALVPQPDYPGTESVAANLHDPASILARLSESGATHVVLVGAVKLDGIFRQQFAAIAGSGPALGDVELSAAASPLFARLGIALLGAHELAPGLLAEEGMIAGPKVSLATQKTASFALAAAREVGRIDLGQSVVVTATRLVAAEDVAGTDELLRRVAQYRRQGLVGDGAEMMVLGKAMKPRQPLFVDLPAIGADTVVQVAQAGIVAIAVEAGRTLIIGRADLVAAAQAHGISVLGLVADD